MWRMATILASADQEELIVSEMLLVGKGKPGTKACLGTGRGHRECMSVSHKKNMYYKIP